MSAPASDRGDAFGVVLVIAERSTRRDELSCVLERAGCRVHSVADVAAGLDLIAGARPDMVLIDLAVLESGGAVVVEHIRALVPWAALVAIGSPRDAATRAAVIRRFALHGIHDEVESPERLQETVESALASASRTRRVLSESELRGLIVAKLCHEVRTCLFVIEGYAEILCDAPDAKGRHEVSARVASTSHFALRLVQDYLDLAKLEPCDATAADEPVDLEEMAEELRTATERRIGRRPLHVSLGGMRGLGLRSDGEKLRCILSQLLAHTVELTGRGEVRLDVRVGADVTDFVVSSSEAEMSADSLQVPRSDASGGDGSQPGVPNAGLGLAIAFRLSRLIGASLDADLLGASGVRFGLRVPIRAELTALDPVQAEQSIAPILH